MTADDENNKAGEDCTTVTDPVCRRAVDPRKAAVRLHYRRANHFFCSMTCARAFAARPQRYAGQAA